MALISGQIRLSITEGCRDEIATLLCASAAQSQPLRFGCERTLQLGGDNLMADQKLNRTGSVGAALRSFGPEAFN
jgi:hypothetical protein